MSLFDSGSKGIKFEHPGDTIVGTISAPPREQQQMKFGTQTPDTWPDGSPKMQILVSLQTDLAEDENDDGGRTLYVASKHMKRAIAQAMRDAKAQDVEIGGKLTVSFTGFDPNSKNPQNPAKLYTASYIKAGSALAQPATTAAPAQQQADPVAAPAVNLTGQQQEQIRALRGMGLDALKIAQSLSLDPNQVALVLAA